MCNALCDKLIFRHPHVYGEVNADTPDAVIQNWEQLKLKEKEGNKSVLSGVPATLPALIKAHRIQDKARNVGFDWEEREQVWDKVQEEIGEFKVEVANCDADKMEAEFGDLMFSIINAARLYKINPENALERTNKKFIRRFSREFSQAAQFMRRLHQAVSAVCSQPWCRTVLSLTLQTATMSVFSYFL